MSRERLTVVLSQAPGKHPARRALEESIVAALLMEPGIDASIIPNLYDLDPQHTGRLFLGSVRGDMVVLSWLYPRAAFWLLDRIDICGHQGEIQLKSADEDEEDADESTKSSEKNTLGSQGNKPDRWIYCLNLQDGKNAEPFIQEIRRIKMECLSRVETKKSSAPAPLIQIGLAPTFATPEPMSALQAFTPEALLAPANRRWYPVIDYSRCTNCMECLDFCLFGVYGLNSGEKILVENQDNCKKGCPACSRVCPEQAIIFPEYKSPAIAGASVGSIGALKIDLTKLFGGDTKDPLAQAVAERDRELQADGREMVGMQVGIPKRQEKHKSQPKDELDHLMDDLDSLGL